MQRTICVLVAAALIAAAAAPRPAAGQDGAFSDEAVQAAIDKGKAFLWSQQRGNGGWEGFGERTGMTFPYGPGALATYALLAAGEDPHSQRMTKALDWLAAGKTEMTYSLGIRCNAWLLAYRQTKDKKYRELLIREATQLAKLILQDDGTEHGTSDGSYSYVTPAKPRAVRNGDNSNSQYGVLGTWAAARLGPEAEFQIPLAYWYRVMEHWKDSQRDDGGFSYKKDLRYSVRSKPAMTVAGVATLFVCFDNLWAEAFEGCNLGEEAQKVRRPIERGLDWLDRYFAGTPSLTNKYFLYGVERVGLASGYKYFGKTDWYKAGARSLIRRQARDGSWKGYGHVVGTSFALLFLARGQHPVLFNKLEFPGDWNNRPRDLANLTRWINRALERDTAWQIINLKVPVREWHDAPLLYLSGAAAPEFTDEQIEKLRQFVWQGGTIFSCTECNGQAFAKGIREVYARAFPGYELKALKPDHPLYRSHRPLPARRVEFHMLSNGVRPWVIHTDADLPRVWQTQPFGGRDEYALDAAINVALYVTNNQALRNRGVALWPKAPTFTPGQSVSVGRLRHAGNWNPEPLACERFARLLGAARKVEVECVGPLAAGKLAEARPDLLLLTGTGPLELPAADRQAVAEYVRAGGTLLVDAAGGDRAFATTAEGVLRETFGRDAWGLLDADSPVYRLDGMEIRQVRYRGSRREREPFLKGVKLDGRVAVVFSPQDLTAGLMGYPCAGCVGYVPDSAFALVRNVALYAAQQRQAEGQE